MMSQWYYYTICQINLFMIFFSTHSNCDIKLNLNWQAKVRHTPHLGLASIGIWTGTVQIPVPGIRYQYPESDGISTQYWTIYKSVHNCQKEHDCESRRQPYDILRPLSTVEEERPALSVISFALQILQRVLPWVNATGYSWRLPSFCLPSYTLKMCSQVLKFDTD